MNPNVDFYFEKASKWQLAYQQLRNIVLDCGLTEELKWGHPCYTLRGKNVVLIHGFKDYCALLFHKGAVLKDTDGILIQQTDHVQAARQIRFTDAKEIVAMAEVLKTYIHQAIEVEKAGLKVDFKKHPTPVPEEFQQRLSAAGGHVLKAAFDALTPGRQRAYILHFSQPKQSKTRESRIDTCIPRILQGKGLTDG